MVKYQQKDLTKPQDMIYIVRKLYQSLLTKAKKVTTDLAIAIPTGTYTRIAPQSGLSIKKSIHIGVVVIDADYRGHSKVVLINNG